MLHTLTKRIHATAPLRVAMVSVHGDPLLPIGAEEAGGQNVYVREVAKALAARGVDVDVFTRGRACGDATVTPLGAARVIRLPAGPRGFISRNELYAHLPEFLGHVRRFASTQPRRYDAVHTNYWLSGWTGLGLGLAWGVPQLHTHHSLGAVKYAAAGGLPASARTRLEIEERLLDAAHTIVATSPEDVASMARHYQGRPNVAIVPCGVDPGVFFRRDARESRAMLGLPADGPVLVYVGRFDAGKGIETFVRAAARLADHPAPGRDVSVHTPHLVFAGGFEPGAPDDAEYARIRTLVAECGLPATFLGKVGREKLPFVFSAADLCVVPSHYESFGLVAIEAMACGTPVVASDVGGLRFSVIHRVTGLLAPARDEAAFADAIGLLLDSPDMRTAMGEAAQALVKRAFTWDAVAERLETTYRGTLTVRQAAAWA